MFDYSFSIYEPSIAKKIADANGDAHFAQRKQNKPRTRFPDWHAPMIGIDRIMAGRKLLGWAQLMLALEAGFRFYA
jgi:hypothetical protein